MKHLLHRLNTIEFNSYKWHQLPNAQLFIALAVIKIFEIEKLQRGFVFSSKSSLKNLAFYM